MYLSEYIAKYQNFAINNITYEELFFLKEIFPEIFNKFMKESVLLSSYQRPTNIRITHGAFTSRNKSPYVEGAHYGPMAIQYVLDASELADLPRNSFIVEEACLDASDLL